MYIEMIKRKKGKTFFVSTFLDCYSCIIKLEINVNWCAFSFWKSVKIGG